MSERECYLGFSLCNGIGPVRFEGLLKHFGSAKKAWNASIRDLVPILGEALGVKFNNFREEFSITDYEERLNKKKVRFLILIDSNYPSLLKQIQRPPFVLYVKGSVEILKQVQNNMEKTIAVVGTRKVTQYGRDVTELLTAELVSAGFTIVSGLAMGVDAVAHQTAIDNNGKTIAVLGCGVDCATPAENQNLYDQIIERGGCVVSELPLGHSPTKGSFPARNRIIAGLSQGVIVTEGAEDSGALITADYALSFGRRVFAVPGPITSQLSKGPYKLIQKGAKLVTTAGDILKEFQISNIKSQINTNNQRTINNITKEEQEILELLENEPLHFDEIVRRSRLSSSQVGSILSIMEMKGFIKTDGSIFSIAS